MSVELLKFFSVLLLTIVVLGSIVLINKNRTLREQKKRLDFYLERYYKSLEDYEKLITEHESKMLRLDGMKSQMGSIQTQLDNLKRLTIDKGGQDEKSTSDPS